MSIRNESGAPARRMRPRDPHEHPRAATPLELLYDLCFVVAIAQAATSLHHAISEGHASEGILGFGLVFFAIWWAWMGFAWFASAFDTDDPLYRLKVLVQMVGVLVLAAGVPRALENQDFSLIVAGYVVMRIGLIAQWIRAAGCDSRVRRTARRYAAGIALVQVGWVGFLAVSPSLRLQCFAALAVFELIVPWWAERAGQTPWHPHHIAERYGLLTIIVIGESVLSATLAIQSAIDLGDVPAELAIVTASAPVILFAMWWLYFARPAHDLLTSNRPAFVWGYGHYFVFGSAAAVGAGLAVLVDHAIGRSHISATIAGQALAIPVAAYLISVWLVHAHRRSSANRQYEALGVLGAVGLTLAAPLTGSPAAVIAVVLTLLTAAMVGLSPTTK